MVDHRQHSIWRAIQFLSPARSNKFLQTNLSRGEEGILASYALIGAVLAFGGLGFLLDRYVDSSPWFAIAGLLFGVCAGFYNLVRITWRR